MMETNQDPVLWFRLSSGLRELLEEGGVKQKNNYLLDDVNIGLREYIKAKKLYDVKQKKVVNCGKDLIGKVFSVSSFSSTDFVTMLSSNIVLSRTEPRPVISTATSQMTADMSATSDSISTYVPTSINTSSTTISIENEAGTPSRKRTNSGDSEDTTSAKRVCDEEAAEKNPVITKYVDVHDYAAVRYMPKAPPQVADWPYGLLCVSIPDPLLHASSGEESDCSLQGYETAEDTNIVNIYNEEDEDQFCSESEHEKNDSSAEFSEEYTIHSYDNDSDKGAVSENVVSDSSSSVASTVEQNQDLIGRLKKFMTYDTEFMADKEENTDSELVSKSSPVREMSGCKIWVCSECCHENRTTFLRCAGCMGPYKPPQGMKEELPSNCKLRIKINNQRQPYTSRRRRKRTIPKTVSPARTPELFDDAEFTRPLSQDSLDSGICEGNSSCSGRDKKASVLHSLPHNQICSLCLVNLKDAVLVHRKTGHQFACYTCSKRMWKDQSPCPICRMPIVKVIKNFVC